MSIILKGIDIPTDRKPYGIEVIYRFEGADGLFSEKNYLSPNEAVQIPKGHGRLIDADALELEKEVEIADDWKTAHEIANCVKYAPTILESEESDESDIERD